MRADPEKTRSWEQTVAEQAASGRSAAAFCRERSVAVARFYQWRRRLRGGSAGTPAAGAGSAAGFVEMLAGSGPGARSSGVALRLGQGLTVAVEPGFDGETLRRVVSALRGTAG
jgi:hypothetical protein